MVAEEELPSQRFCARPVRPVTSDLLPRPFSASQGVQHRATASMVGMMPLRSCEKMLIDRGAAGDRDKARQLFEEVIGEYKTIGMPRHLEMAQELLAAP